MTECGQEKIAAFDTLFSTNHIQMLKILLTYMEPSQQKSIAVYIKFMELQYTLSFFNIHPASSLSSFSHKEDFNAAKLCDELFPLCNHAEQENLKHMKEMYQNFANMQEMMQMVQMMKELFPEGQSGDGEGNSDFLSSLMGMAGMSGMPDLSGIDLTQFADMFGSKDN